MLYSLSLLTVSTYGCSYYSRFASLEAISARGASASSTRGARDRLAGAGESPQKPQCLYSLMIHQLHD